MARETTFHINILKCYPQPTRRVEVKLHHTIVEQLISLYPPHRLCSALNAECWANSWFKIFKSRIGGRGPIAVTLPWDHHPIEYLY